ncbi:four helix bundle protein [Mucilaginibacter sp. McL0603]|uniref:four helix bundle protein n=1 Tax=Mucilaginibacter sp. McL0603 TaxID=3415670 RepID=UPI003CF81A82
MQDFKKLVVWQKAIKLITVTYQIVSTFPSEEKYVLISQLKRAVLSISNNIAEGCGRFTKNDFVHFLQMALGSTNEVENCILVSKELKYLNDDSFETLNKQNTEVRKMLIALIEKIRKGE